MVTDEDFKDTLDKAKKELISNQQRLGRILQEQEELENRNTKLREVVNTLSRLLGEQFVEEDAIGLTDAIRQAFKTSSTPLQPTEIRDRLKSIGLDITKYGNVMASVHSVINRLLSRREIQQVAVGGKPAYQWKPSGRLYHPPSP
jgi:chromosome segregation ATPase